MPIEKKCLRCGEIIKVFPSRIKTGRGKYCSKKCQNESLIGRRKGEKNFNWRGGQPKCRLCQKIISYKTKNQLCIKCWGKLHKGKNASGWIDGRTPINELIRKSSEYKEWRKKVLERDNWTCQICGYYRNKKRERRDLNVDHIKPFAFFIELRFDIDNGRTLCKDCHLKTITYGIKPNKFKELLKNGVNSGKVQNG